MVTHWTHPPNSTGSQDMDIFIITSGQVWAKIGKSIWHKEEIDT